MIALITVAAITNSYPTRADGNFYTVQKILELCEQPNGSPAKTQCFGLIVGVAQTSALIEMMLVAKTDPVSDLIACHNSVAPTSGAEAQAFVNWAKRHPEHWSRPAAVGVIAALRQTWPCKS
jgi:hypothetical protein